MNVFIHHECYQKLKKEKIGTANEQTVMWPNLSVQQYDNDNV